MWKDGCDISYKNIVHIYALVERLNIYIDMPNHQNRKKPNYFKDNDFSKSKELLHSLAQLARHQLSRSRSLVTFIFKGTFLLPLATLVPG